MAVDESDAAQLGFYVCVTLSKRNQLYCHYTVHYCRYVVLTGCGKCETQLKYLVLKSVPTECVFE